MEKVCTNKNHAYKQFRESYSKYDSVCCHEDNYKVANCFTYSVRIIRKNGSRYGDKESSSA
jgi:hypothetical protein